MNEKNANEEIEEISPYRKALRKFLKETNHNPNFFKLSPEKQKEIAMGYVNEEKKELSIDKEKEAQD